MPPTAKAAKLAAHDVGIDLRSPPTCQGDCFARPVNRARLNGSGFGMIAALCLLPPLSVLHDNSPSTVKLLGEYMRY
jgi:hypothetical protein